MLIYYFKYKLSTRLMHILLQQHVFKGGWKSPYNDIISAVDFFLLVGSKHCNTDGRSVWTARFSLFSLFQSISTFMGYLIPKQ